MIYEYHLYVLPLPIFRLQGVQSYSYGTDTSNTNPSQASVNHQNVAEILSTSLDEISGPVEDCGAVVNLMNTSDMHEAISSLYSRLFHFLYSAMKWYQASSARRILDSLTENSSDSFKIQISKIKEICNWICRRGLIKSQAETRDIRKELEATKELIEKEAAKDALAREEAREANRRQAMTTTKWTAIGQQLVEDLREHTREWLHKDENKAQDDKSSSNAFPTKCPDCHMD